MRRLVIGGMAVILVCVAAVAGAQNVEEWYSRGADAYEAGDYERAIEYYTKVIELEPGDVYAYCDRGWAHYNNGNVDTARADFRTACDMGYDEACKILDEIGD